jgi:hypothetical protein
MVLTTTLDFILPIRLNPLDSRDKTVIEELRAAKAPVLCGSYDEVFPSSTLRIFPVGQCASFGAMCAQTFDGVRS